MMSSMGLYKTYFFAALCLPALVLTSCKTSKSQPAVVDKPNYTAIVNGSRQINAEKYELNVTILDDEGVPVHGSITSTSVSLTSGVAASSVCGQIRAQGSLQTVLSLDSTSSMAQTDPDGLRTQAAKAFVDRMRAEDQAAVMSFDTATEASEGLSHSHLWQAFTDDKALLNTAVRQATFHAGGTPLYNAVIDASRLLSKQEGTRSILLLTDGHDNAGNAYARDALSAAQSQNARVFAIGIDTTGELNFAALRAIAEESGGLFMKANLPEELEGYFLKMHQAMSADACIAINVTTPSGLAGDLNGLLNLTFQQGETEAELKDIPFTLSDRN